MPVSISTLRVNAEFDAGGYQQGMAVKVAADESGIKSSDGLGAALARQDAAAQNSSGAVTRLSRTFIDGYKPAADHAKAISNVGLMLDAGSISSQRAALAIDGINRRYGMTADAADLASRGHVQLANIVATVNERFGQASRVQAAFSTVTQDLNARVMAAGSSLGIMGNALTALGPVGLGVAAGLGILTLGLKMAVDQSHALAEKAIELRAFSDISGLTTTAVQALRTEAAKFALTSDEAQTAVQNFTARFNELRLGSGALYTQLSKIDPALRDQMASTMDAGQALTLFGQALLKVDDIFQRNALIKAATGRGGLSASQFLSGLDVAGVTKSFQDAGRGLDENLINKLRQAQIDIDETSKKLKDNFAKLFAADVLEGEKTFLDRLVQITDWMKKIKENNVILNWLGPTVGPTLGFQPYPKPPTSLGVPGIGDEFGGAGLSSGKVTLEKQISDQKALTAVLGVAATEAEKLALKQRELELAARDAGVSTDVLRRAQAGLNQEFALAREADKVAALGSAATVTEQYKLRVDQLAESLAHGKINQDTFNRAVAGLNQDQTIQRMRDQISALGPLATETQQYQLRVAELSQMQKQGRISQEQLNVAVIAAHPAFQQALASSTEFASGFLKDIAKGTSAMDALKNAASHLGDTLIDVGTKSLVQSAFSGLAQSLSGAGPVAGATSAATILTSAGASVGASMVSGATAAAQILGLSVPTAAATLPVAGAATGTEVAAGGATGGAALAAGGATAGSALWGPVAALAAIAVGIGISTALQKKPTPETPALARAGKSSGENSPAEPSQIFQRNQPERVSQEITRNNHGKKHDSDQRRPKLAA